MREYKRRTFALLDLRAGLHVLDVGCGRGDDAIALAKIVGPGGRAVGVDQSAAMLAVARSAAHDAGVTAEFVEADAASLPFPDDSFDACRIDRTLEHLQDPAAVVRELVRVCRPGGRVATAEPDWDTLAIDAPDLETSRAVTRAQSAEIAHGTIGRSLRRLLIEAGLREVVVDTMALAFEDLPTAEAVYGIRHALAKVVKSHQVERARADAWWRALEDAEAAGTFWASMIGTIAVGRKP